MKLTKGKIIAAVAVIAVLAGAFWYGGNAPGLQAGRCRSRRAAQCWSRAARLRSGGIHSAYRDTWRGGGKPPADGER